MKLFNTDLILFSKNKKKYDGSLFSLVMTSLSLSKTLLKYRVFRTGDPSVDTNNGLDDVAVMISLQ